jgi:hypothetical protein
MPQSRDPVRYQDLIEGVLYPALESDKGKKITCLTKEAAFNLKMRLQAAVKNLRRQSTEIYPADHPLYAKTEFDKMVISADGPVVMVRKAEPSLVADTFQAIIEDIV